MCVFLLSCLQLRFCSLRHNKKVILNVYVAFPGHIFRKVAFQVVTVCEVCFINASQRYLRYFFSVLFLFLHSAYVYRKQTNENLEYFLVVCFVDPSVFFLKYTLIETDKSERKKILVAYYADPCVLLLYTFFFRLKEK